MFTGKPTRTLLGKDVYNLIKSCNFLHFVVFVLQYLFRPPKACMYCKYKGMEPFSRPALRGSLQAAPTI